MANEFITYLENRPITENEVRTYLKGFLTSSTSTYANRLKGLRHYLRDWLGLKDLAMQFKFPEQRWIPTQAPKKDELQLFYHNLTTLESKTAFLLWATSGKRRNEIINLTKDQLDIKNNLIIPPKNNSRTKHEWYAYFNEECTKILTEYLSTIKGKENIFSKKQVREEFEKTYTTTDIHITPKRLRDWFCQEMGELGVPDRFIDAFCGRSPKSVLARHYSDYSPDRLKLIYDKAGLKVLS